MHAIIFVGIFVLNTSCEPIFSLVQLVFRANGDDLAQLATGYVIIYPLHKLYLSTYNVQKSLPPHLYH